MGCHRSTEAQWAQWWRRESSTVRTRRSKCQPLAPPSSPSARATCPRPSGMSRWRDVRWTPSEADVFPPLPGRQWSEYYSVIVSIHYYSNPVSCKIKKKHPVQSPKRRNYWSENIVPVSQKTDYRLLNRSVNQQVDHKPKLILSFHTHTCTHTSKSWSCVLICVFQQPVFCHFTNTAQSGKRKIKMSTFICWLPPLLFVACAQLKQGWLHVVFISWRELGRSFYEKQTIPANVSKV